MPLFNRELNELADRIGRSNLTVWLHTAAPTNGAPTNARTNVGGGAYEGGATLLATQISNATNGDINNSALSTSGPPMMRSEQLRIGPPCVVPTKSASAPFRARLLGTVIASR